MSYPDSPTYLEMFGDNTLDAGNSLVIPLFNLQEVLQDFENPLTEEIKLLVAIHECLRRTFLSYILIDSREFLTDGKTVLLADYTLYYNDLKCITLGKRKEGDYDVFAYSWQFSDPTLPILEAQEIELFTISGNDIIMNLEVIGSPLTTLKFCKGFLSYLKSLNSPFLSVKYNYLVEIYTYSANTILEIGDIVNG